MTKYDVGSLPYELQKIALGACFLGSGGGGKLETSLKYIDDFFSKNEIIQNFQLTDLITDLVQTQKGESGIVVAYMGAPQKMDSIKCPDAVCKGIEKFVNDMQNKDQNFKGIDYIIPVEIGPVSTITACLTAHKMGKPVLNVDGAGRAVPTLDLISYTTNAHVSVNPTFLCSENENENKKPPEAPVYHQIKLEIFGDKKPGAVFSDDTDSGAASKMESLARPVLNMAEFDQKAGLVMWYFDDVTELKDIPHASVPETLTFCRELGGAIQSMQKQNMGFPEIENLFSKELFKSQSIYPAIKENYPAIKEMCRGKLISATISTAGGFDAGVITIEGDSSIKDYSGHQYTIIFQNESLILWDSNSAQPLVMAPDLICYLIDYGKYVFTNGDIMRGDALKEELHKKEIVVYGIAAPRALMESESNMIKHKKKLCNTIAGVEHNALPEHYMSILNNIGYYGRCKSLKE
ncbi:MAG: DUF917 family protein [Fibrobacter sp.]|nr:DUF917 family protein [Fibrobacter sp.]